MSHLILPRSARPAFQCNIPGCEAKFYAEEKSKYIRHVATCARKHRGELEELSSKRPFKGTPIGEALDPEAEDFMRRSIGKRP